MDGRPLPRDALVQVDRQRRAVLQRMGLGDVDPDRIVGYEWLICFPRARLDPTMSPAVKRHLVTARDIRWRIRNQTPTAHPRPARRHGRGHLEHVRPPAGLLAPEGAGRGLGVGTAW